MQSVREFLHMQKLGKHPLSIESGAATLGARGRLSPQSICESAAKTEPGAQEYVQFFLPACTKVTAEVMTMSSTEQPRDKSLIGEAKPCKIGPNASAPAKRCTNL